MSDEEKTELSVWVAFNEDGEHESSPDRDTALEYLRDNFGGSLHRAVEIKLKVNLPKDVTVSVDVPDEAGTIEAVEAA